MDCLCKDDPSFCPVPGHYEETFQRRVARFYMHTLRTSQRRFQSQRAGSMRISLALNKEFVPHLCPTGAQSITLTALFSGDGDIQDWDILVEDGTDKTRWSGMGERALRERLGGV